jgi:hypothetical protein
MALGGVSRYCSSMGKIIRRTVTITITESWTIVWLPDDNPVHYSAVGHERLKPDEGVLLQMSFEKEVEQESEQQFKKENRDE